MIDIVKMNQCVVCGNCVNACPENCIELKEKFESFEYPVIDYDKCIKCEKCSKVCPALNPPEQRLAEDYYAVKNKNQDILKISSSGGVFYSLAKHVIDNNGCVVGAAFNEDFEVKHILINDIDDLPKLCGSKYVQSDMNNVVKAIKTQLDSGNNVLFCGCSCQTAAVKAYFGEKYRNLLLVDFICHGAVSASVFGEYKEYLEKKYGSKIKSFSFRDKSNGWLYSGPRVEFENGNEYKSSLSKDLYMQGYFNNLNVKLSCYSCKYKNYCSGSDITMGDFWGIQSLIPEFYGKMGNSAVVINTETGRKLWENVIESFDFMPVAKSLILQENSGLEKPFTGDLKERSKYFHKAERVGYIKPLEKYIYHSPFTKILNYLKRFVHRNH